MENIKKPLKRLTKKEIERIKHDANMQGMLAYQFGMAPDTWYQYAVAEKRKKLDVPAIIEKVREYIAKFPTPIEPSGLRKLL